MRDFIEFIGYCFGVFATIGAIIMLCFGLSCYADYWNGSARATLLEKQTGVYYTWREAAQIKTMYDRQNVRISFVNETETKESTK